MWKALHQKVKQLLWRRVLPAEAMMAPLVQMAPALTATVALVEMEVSRRQSLTETAVVMDLALMEASRRQNRGSELVVTGVRSRVGDSLWQEVVDAGAGD